MEPFTLAGTTFEDGGMIPVEHTCEGVNLSPGLQWAGAPGQAQSFVLIMDDPDAPDGTFTHWVLFDIPGTTSSFEAGRAVGFDAMNDFGEPGYRGPCPPPGDEAHGYRFTLYALDVDTIEIGQTATRREVEGAMQGHVIARAQLRARYGRRERSAGA
jgi:Raf kinase inhibitor-like YbhB/YbcL family protein